MGNESLKAIIFDFDGVICESVEVKTIAFRRLFEDHPKHLDQIIEYHKINGGLSRYEKFKVIYRDFLKKSLSEQESQKLGEKFTQYSLEAVLACEYVAGAVEFLKKYHKKLKLFIVSGTPEDEMRMIVKKRGLTKYFQAVYGSPRKKDELIKHILKESKLKPNNVIFVGDSINDYEGAVKAGVEFIGRVHSHEPNPFSGLKDLLSLIQDVTQLERLLEGSESILKHK